MSKMDRRNFILRSGLAVGAGVLLPALKIKAKPLDTGNWGSVRSQFSLATDRINMALMLLASHPKQVSDAIENHRKNFDNDPVTYWEEKRGAQEDAVKAAAAKYIGADPSEIALTDSTTMGLAILYGGLKLNKDDEILTTTHDHYSTEKSLEFSTQKNGASIKRIDLYKDAQTITVDEVTANLKNAIGPKTRIVAVTWVHSSTGVKLPLREMADLIQQVNKSRSEKERIYFCVDGVHGFGVGNVTMSDLGCDFFVAGTHKWLFGPRGTGILFAKKDAWDMIAPTIPAFSWNSYGAWLGVVPPENITFSDSVTPGGFHSFEYRWALKEAFNFHLNIGKAKIEKRTQQLASMLKQGLQSINHVKLHTPLSTKFSAGINCFEVKGLKETEVVERLHKKHIIASNSPYRISYARLTPCILNTEAEVMTCLKALENINS